jgi:hypothetical protein
MTKGTQMGTNVHGLKPKHSVGEQFGRNVWGWTPLMGYISAEHKKFEKLFEKNRLTELQANKIADALFDDIASGKAEAYADNFAKEIAGLPEVECDLCGGTGIRKDEVGMEKGMTDLVLDPRLAQQLRRVRGWCNGCFGWGKKKSSDSAYYLELTDLQEFAEFLRNCGGAKLS